MVTNFVPPSWEAINDYQNVGSNWTRSVLGTKWGAYDVEVETGPEQLIYQFTTAWTGLSDTVIEAMSKRFPALAFRYQYDEPGNLFEGAIAAEAGEITEEWDREGDNYEGILCGPPESGEEVSEEGQV